MRGRAAILRNAGLQVGITPARAGKRRSAGLLEREPRNYPRSCGEETGHYFMPFSSAELPPLVRGRDQTPLMEPSHHGITPARAGKSTPKP